MSSYVLAGLVAAQFFVTATPAAAAGPGEWTTVQSGTFAGARIRLSLGGQQHDRKVRAGLTLAPTLRSQTLLGETSTRIGEGLEVGFAGERSLAVSLAGQPATRSLPGGEKRSARSTSGKVAIGVGAVALVAGAIVLGVVISHSDDAPDES